jgi:excisionase family DNA binding protein
MDVLSAPINEAAKSIGVGRSTIYKLIAEGQLQTIKIGRRRLVKTESIRAFVDQAA